MSGSEGEARQTRASGRLPPVAGYALIGATVVVAAAGLAVWLAPAGVWEPIVMAAAAAYAIQVAAFALLWRMRDRAAGFFVAWGGGTLVRLAAVLGVGVWVVGAAHEAAVPLLLSFAGFLFLLLMLEPLVYRAGLRNR